MKIGMVWVWPLFFLIVSCGIFRSKNKEIRDEKKVLSEVSRINRDSVYEKVDKSIIFTKRSMTGVLSVPGIRLTDSRPFDPLQWYGGITLYSDGLYTVRQQLDSVSGHLNTIVEGTGGNIPIQVSEETTRQNNITETTKLTSAAEKETETKEESHAKVKTTEPAKVGNVTAIALGALVIILLFAWFYFKRK